MPPFFHRVRPDVEPIDDGRKFEHVAGVTHVLPEKVVKLHAMQGLDRSGHGQDFGRVVRDRRRPFCFGQRQIGGAPVGERNGDIGLVGAKYAVGCSHQRVKSAGANAVGKIGKIKLQCLVYSEPRHLAGKEDAQIGLTLAHSDGGFPALAIQALQWLGEGWKLLGVSVVMEEPSKLGRPAADPVQRDEDHRRMIGKCA